MGHHQDTLVVTYCCREKNPSPDLLPAKDRYLSSRIRVGGEAATRRGFEFRILSGLYGLLEAGQMIPDYDHLLTAEQVPEHVVKLKGQLAKLKVAKVIFITRTLEEDPGTEAYRQAMGLACAAVEVDLEILEIGPGEPAVTELAERM